MHLNLRSKQRHQTGKMKFLFHKIFFRQHTRRAIRQSLSLQGSHPASLDQNHMQLAHQQRDRQN